MTAVCQEQWEHEDVSANARGLHYTQVARQEAVWLGEARHEGQKAHRDRDGARTGSGDGVKRTYIPKFLGLVQDMAMYLTLHRQHMVGAASLTEEQQQALRDLVVALGRVQLLLGPLFPRPEPRARPKRDLWGIDIRGMHERQQGCCYYCGTKLFPYGIWPKSTKFEGARRYQVEHAQPVSRGGTDAPDNLRLACEECNRHKGMLTEAEFLAVLATRG